jgi:hypothetical protein
LPRLEPPVEGLAVGLCAALVGVTVGVVFFTVGVTVGVVFTVGVTVGVVVGACVGDGDGEETGTVGVGDVGTGVLLTGEPCTPGVVVGVGVWVAPGVEVFTGVALAMVPFVLAASVMLVTARRPVTTSRAIMIWLPGVHPFPLPSQSVVSKVPWSSVSVEPGLPS